MSPVFKSALLPAERRLSLGCKLRGLALSHDKIVINAALFKKLGMRADLGDSAVFEHNEPVRMAQGRKSVGNGYCCSVLNQSAERFLNMALCLGVERACCLVENEYLRVAQLQSFSKAAESLGYSQSAVTVQVQQLENELGVRLFDRIGKTVSITHYGQEFIPYARDVVSAAARAVSFTVEERDLTGTLRIGTIESIMTASFGEILPLYHEHCPHVSTQLIEGDTKTLSDMLMHNEVDLIYTLDDMGYDAQRIKLFECPQEIVIVASPKHPFAAAKQLKLADLVNEPFVLMPQFNSYRHQFDMELAHQKLSIRPFLELESTSMVMQLLEHNPYLSVLPRYTARRRAEEGRLAILPVTDCHMEQWSQLVHHRDKVLTPQIRAMVSVIAQVENIPLHLED